MNNIAMRFSIYLIWQRNLPLSPVINTGVTIGYIGRPPLSRTQQTCS